MSILVDQTHSRVKIEGSEYVIEAIVRNMMSGETNSGLMGTFLPIPTLIEVLLPDEIFSWQEEHWGAMWGDYDTKIVERNYGSVVIDFWSWFDPLFIGLEKLSAMFPTVTLRGSYTQLRYTMVGTYAIRDGELLFHERHTSDDDSNLEEMMCEWSNGGKEKWIQFSEKVLSTPGMAFV